MPMSTTLADAVSALIRNNTPISAFASGNRYIALHTGNPTKDCTLLELNSANYARVAMPLESIPGDTGDDISNISVVVFPIASDTIVAPITHFSIWDSLENGTPITYGKLSVPVNWISGSSLSFGIHAFIQTVRTEIPV
jgi:hypothetical protein